MGKGWNQDWQQGSCGKDEMAAQLFVGMKLHQLHGNKRPRCVGRIRGDSQAKPSRREEVGVWILESGVWDSPDEGGNEEAPVRVQPASLATCS